MNLPPLLFQPILKPRVWGGRRLARYGKRLPPDERIGESWEVADLPDSIPDGRSVVYGGPFDGATLRDLRREHANELMGAAPLNGEPGFPLLIKFLDARENLSVQVHPDEAYVERHPGAHLKSEAWFVVEAEPGAVIYAGIKPDVTPEQFADDIERGSVVDDLIRIPVTAGDCHYLPGGTCHALGAGVLAAEVQTPSDTTFRVYDWGRTDRELHLDEAMECIHFGEPPHVRPHAPSHARSSVDPVAGEGVREPGLPHRSEPIETAGLRSQRLIACPHFEIERIETLDGSKLELETGGMPEVWMVLAGTACLLGRGQPAVELAAGSTLLLPASVEPGDAQLGLGTLLLRITLPSPLKGLIA